MLNLLACLVVPIAASARVHFVAPQVLETIAIAPEIKGATEPQAAFIGEGRLAVAFGSGESVYVAVQRSGSAQEYLTRLVAAVPDLALGMRRGPRISASGSEIVVSCISAKRKGTGNLIAYRSSDQGETWSGPFQINDHGGSAAEGLHAMCALGSKFACVWLDDRAGRKQLYYSESADGGKSWSKNELIYKSPSGSICECCHPSIAPGPAGAAVMMWRNSLDGNRDLYWCSRDSSGKVGEAQKLGEGTWPLKGCPMDGGAVVSLGPSGVASIWRREDSIFFCRAGEPEMKLGPGMQPWLAGVGDSVWAVWLEKRQGPLLAKMIGATRTSAMRMVLAESAEDPFVVSDGERTAVVWTGQNGIALRNLAP